MDLPGERAVWVCRPSAPALVLGSGQSALDVDVDVDAARSAGVEVVRRRSGGGLVWVHPEDTLWLDVTIGRDDPWWSDDVSSSMLWLGESLSDALDAVGFIGATAHRGPFEPGPIGRSVCFAGVAPGEVVRNGAKVVGLSQRRGRWGARFQCLVHRRWRPDSWAGFLRDPALRDAVGALAVTEVATSVDALAGALWGVVGADRAR
jgi:lipoate-protein ligase A